MDKTTPNHVVNLSEIREALAGSKAASSARYYLTALKRFEAFNGDAMLDLGELTPGYIAEFRDYLIREKVAPTTISQLLRCLRATFKPIFGPDGRAEFKRAFADVESTNAKASHPLGSDELRQLAIANFDGIEFLQKIRDVFMLAFYGGGMPLESLKDAIAGLATSGVAQQAMILRQFPDKYYTQAEEFLRNVTAEDYAKALDTIGYKLRLNMELRPESAAASWIAIARERGIADDVIADALAAETDFGRNIIKNNTSTAEMVRNALETVANAVFDTVPRWYVMRCHEDSPQATAMLIRDKARLTDVDFLETFIAPSPDPRSGKDAGGRIMAKMLFFHCIPDLAAQIRKAMAPTAYVFTLAGSKTPAFISDSEMRTFMFLCNVGAPTIAYHFPAYETKNIEEMQGKKARITDGHFVGTSCVIEGISKERYKVVVKISTLGNLKITAEIPEEFLCIENV